MDRSYFSASWYRVAGLRPRLRSHAAIHRNHFRGQLWYVLQDRTSGRFHRFTPQTYFVISLMDGERTVQEIWDIACAQLDDEVLTQDELIGLLNQLHAADVLYGSEAPDIRELAERGAKQRKRKLMMSVLNPLAIRVPLFDPDEFLSATFPLVRPLFSIVGGILFLVFAAYVVILAASNWDLLTADVTDRILSADNLILLLLAYPFVKSIHELGHAYAIKRWGGEVHEIGVMFLVLMPVPYVDASDSIAFPSKWKRAFVAGAGIVVEVILAGIALIVWLNVEEGFVSAFAFNVMVIGGISTLLFNGNPLLKFDGYYVLSELIEIPNMATRANKYIGYLLQRYAFGVRDAVSPATARSERPWLAFYSVAAFAYRMLIIVAIVSLVSRQFFIIGTLIAIWAVILMLVVPIAKQLMFLFTSPVLRRHRSRALGVTFGTVAALAAGVLFVPLPHSTVVEGVVWVPGDGVVNAGVDGEVVRLFADPGAELDAGAPILELAEPSLATRITMLEGRIAELGHRLDMQNLTNQAAAQMVEEELQAVEAELANARARQEALVVRAGTAGTLILPDARDLLGRYFHRGDTVGYVATFDRPVVRVIVGEGEADMVRNQTSAVEVRFVGAVGISHAAEIAREVPALSDTLPSEALSTEGGGRLTLDPTDAERRRVLSNLLQLDIRLTSDRHTPTLGGRVYVRFFHGVEPLASRLNRTIRQVFLRNFEV